MALYVEYIGDKVDEATAWIPTENDTMSSNQYTCPKCNTTLRTVNVVAPGMQIRCPKCQAVFAPAGESAAGGNAEVLPRPEKRAEDISAQKPPAPRSGGGDADKDDLPREPSKKQDKKGSLPILILGLAAGGMALLLVACLAGAWMLGLFSKGQGTASTPASEPTYTIKLKEQPEAGKSVVLKSHHRTIVTFKQFDEEGLLLSDTKTERVEEEICTKTVLESGKDRPRKYKKSYEKALLGDGVRENPRSYQGRTILFELQGDRYQVREEGEPNLKPRDREELEAKANDKEGKGDLDQILLPGKPVKVGETWNVDAIAFARKLSDEGELVGGLSSGQGKLVRAYQKDGKQYGVIEWDMKVASRIAQGIRLEEPTILEFKLTADGVIDGSSVAGTGTMTMKQSFKVPPGKSGEKFHQERSLELSVRSDTSDERDASP